MMGTALGTGVPAWPNIGEGFDLSPLVMVLVAILAGRFVGRLALAAGSAWVRRSEPR